MTDQYKVVRSSDFASYDVVKPNKHFVVSRRDKSVAQKIADALNEPDTDEVAFLTAVKTCDYHGPGNPDPGMVSIRVGQLPGDYRHVREEDRDALAVRLITSPVLSAVVAVLDEPYTWGRLGLKTRVFLHQMKDEKERRGGA